LRHIVKLALAHKSKDINRRGHNDLRKERKCLNINIARCSVHACDEIYKAGALLSKKS